MYWLFSLCITAAVTLFCVFMYFKKNDDDWRANVLQSSVPILLTTVVGLAYVYFWFHTEYLAMVECLQKNTVNFCIFAMR